MEAWWYYARGGQQSGPVSSEQLRQLAREGQIGPWDMVWREGLANWVEASRVRGLFGGAETGELEVMEAGAAESSPRPGPQQAMPMNYYGVAPGGYPPPNYLAQAILVTLFCCLPFGVVAIVYAAQVNSKYLSGDYAGALEASGRAKVWSWVSFLVVAIPVALLFVLWLVLVCGGMGAALSAGAAPGILVDG